MLLVASSCSRDDRVDVGAAASSSTRPSASPVDRLAPDELAETPQLVFGFPVPQGMRVDRTFPDEVKLVGHVAMHRLVAYTKKHVKTSTIRLRGKMLVFEQAHIGQDPSNVFRVEVSDAGPMTTLSIRNVTRPKAPPNLSEAERWKRAGRNPDGTPLDPAALK